MSKRTKSQNRQNTRKSLNKSFNSNKSKVNKRKSRQKLKQSGIKKKIKTNSPDILKMSLKSIRQTQTKTLSTPVLKIPPLNESSRQDQMKIVSTPIGGRTRSKKNRKSLRKNCIQNIFKSSLEISKLDKRNETPKSKNNQRNRPEDNDKSVILIDSVPESEPIDKNDAVILIDITSDSFPEQDCKSQTDDQNSVPIKTSKEVTNQVESGVIEIDDLETDNVINLTSDSIINLTSDTEYVLNESADVICLNSPLQPKKVAPPPVNKTVMETVVLDKPDIQKNKHRSPVAFGRRAKVARTQISQTSIFDNKKLLPDCTFKTLNSASSSSHQKEQTDISKFTQRLKDLEQQHLKLIGNTDSTSVNNSNNNFYHPTVFSKQGLRLIVIDGSNVAMGHSQGKFFSCRGLKICIDYFLKRGHRVKAFVPQFRRQRKNSSCPELLESLAKQNIVVFTPSRNLNGQMVIPYDDRFIIQCAAESEGIVVSNDNYRDLIDENPKWRSTIEKRLLMWTWVDDMIMFPSDPLGRHGPTLDEFLRFP